ncbi:hypothetical protein [Streptomyces sp. W1SF4]|uniref:hypothetical protein n=1 Tax=Streptomyces sp. W1SF4 TaxID=2305220 RepID=UPI000F6F019B|nr:hypothetical protein [Streptomyces sp. W1SF4]AZM91461.1 hypothetical protein D1J60_25745 [Streptomyces sp. W1SF4]
MEAITQLITTAYTAAVHGEVVQAADALDAIGFSVDARQMYGVCCAFAEAGTRAVQLLDPTGFDPAKGEMLALSEVTPGAAAANPQTAWAQRFFVAHANRDPEMTNALYATAIKAGPDQFSESVAALLLVVASLGRAVLESRRTP